MAELKLSEITADEEFIGSETFLVNTPEGTRLATYNQLKAKVEADVVNPVKADLTQLDEKVDGLSGAESGGGYGTCDTATDTVAKVVTIDRYSLVKGGMPVIKFTHSCCANATLNISGKGAKPILVRGSAITADDIADGDTCTFVYDGTNYILTDTDAVIDGDVEVEQTVTEGTEIAKINDTPIYAPASGGGGIDYSTNEQDTGLKWIDGKNIYQRTVDSVNVVYSDYSFVFNDAGEDDISVVGIDGVIICDSSSQVYDINVLSGYGAYYQYSNGNRQFVIIPKKTGRCVVTYRYTKSN